ncbi:MAG: hypothetical protein ACRC7S_13055 [Cetobacterium sp.]
MSFRERFIKVNKDNVDNVLEILRELSFDCKSFDNEIFKKYDTVNIYLLKNKNITLGMQSGFKEITLNGLKVYKNTMKIKQNDILNKIRNEKCIGFINGDYNYYIGYDTECNMYVVESCDVIRSVNEIYLCYNVAKEYVDRLNNWEE